MAAGIELQSRTKEGGSVEQLGERHWRLAIPAGRAGRYRWAQLDDYMGLPRSRFPWRPPLRLSLRARVSGAGLPGTWGFGLWNDPFTAASGLGGTARRLPALPNAAWYFHASPPNYLALRDDHPAQGLLAATFAAPHLPLPLLLPAAPLLPLLLVPVGGRLLRRLGRLLIGEDAAAPGIDPTAWHGYGIEWRPERVAFAIDGRPCFETAASPRGPLGLVIWIDNQYAAFTPEGRLRFGTLANAEAGWLEVADVAIEDG